MKYWLGKTKPLYQPYMFKKLLWNLKNLTEFSIYWLSNWLTDPATGYFSLFNIASAWEVPFDILQYLQCIFHILTRVLPCVPFIFAESRKCRFGSGRSRNYQREFPFWKLRLRPKKRKNKKVSKIYTCTFMQYVFLELSIHLSTLRNILNHPPLVC